MILTELSFSSLSEYLQYCPLKYYYRKIAQVEPEFVPAELKYGVGVHLALEAHFRALREGKSRSEGFLLKLFRAAFAVPKIRSNCKNLDELTDGGGQTPQAGRSLGDGRDTGRGGTHRGQGGP